MSMSSFVNGALGGARVVASFAPVARGGSSLSITDSCPTKMSASGSPEWEWSLLVVTPPVLLNIASIPSRRWAFGDKFELLSDTEQTGQVPFLRLIHSTMASLLIV